MDSGLWILCGAAAVILVGVIGLDFRIRRHPGRACELRLAKFLLWTSIILLAVSVIWKPRILAGLLLTLAAANAYIALQRARAFSEVDRLRGEAVGAKPEYAAESPYEQFVNTFFSYLDRGEADIVEFEFRSWRMEVRFKKGETVIPVTDTPFHMLLQIKRLFDAATVRNAKTGESKMRYAARGMLYEFLSEDIGGTLLRLRLLGKRPATPEEVGRFERLLSNV